MSKRPVALIILDGFALRESVWQCGCPSEQAEF